MVSSTALYLFAIFEIALAIKVAFGGEKKRIFIKKEREVLSDEWIQAFNDIKQTTQVRLVAGIRVPGHGEYVIDSTDGNVRLYRRKIPPKRDILIAIDKDAIASIFQASKLSEAFLLLPRVHVEEGEMPNVIAFVRTLKVSAIRNL